MRKRIITAALLCCAVLGGCSQTSETMTAEVTEPLPLPDVRDEDKDSKKDVELDVYPTGILTGSDAYFSVKNITGYPDIELVDADTGEVMGKMLDDGEFELSGDSNKNDGRYTLKHDFDLQFSDPDNIEQKEFHFYARYTDETSGHRSDVMSLTVYEPYNKKNSVIKSIFSRKRKKVVEQTDALMASEEFSAASPDERRKMTYDLLKKLENEGLVDKGSSRDIDDQVECTIDGNVLIYMPYEFDPNLD